MLKEQIWNILSIEKTKDKDVIKEAYRDKLVDVNPEDDAKGFKELREAYEMALAYADEVEDNAPKTPMDEWIDKACAIYNNIYRRIDKKEYKALFEEEICVSLDTCDEARERFIVFLMDHYNFPQDIYKLFDNEFLIVQSKKELLEKFPPDFLDYVEYQVNHPTFINYNLFETTGLSDDEACADAYINAYFEARKCFDEENFEEAKKIIENSKSFEIYHPYMDAEIMRIANMEKDVEKTEEVCDKLMSRYSGDKYIKYICAAIMYDNGKYEEAMEHMNSLLRDDNNHYGAKLYAIREEKRLKNFEKAKEMVLDMLEKYSQDMKLIELMREINEDLQKSLYEKYEESGLAADGVEYAWCLFQNEDYDGALKFLDGLDESAKEEYEYINLYGRCLFASQRDKEAIPYLEKWKKMILEAEDDGTEKYQKKLKRKGFSHSMLAMCYMNEERYDEAVENFKGAVETEMVLENRLSFMERFAYCYIKMGENEKAVDMCDKILEIDKNYYPAYVNRQEAYFNLKHAQEVIDDYYNAINLYRGYYRPYYFAARVFFTFRQYDNAKEVVANAKENNCYNGAIEFYDLKVDRMSTTNQEERHAVIDKLIDLLSRMSALSEDDKEVEDISEIIYEICLAYYDDRNYEKALLYADDAIKSNSGDVGYVWTKADILSAMGKIDEALECYGQVNEKWPDNAELYYDMGRTYLRAKDKDKAKDCFRKTLQLNPEHPDANNQLMNIHQEDYEKYYDPIDYNEGVKYADRQIEINPNCYYHIDRGLLFMAGAEYEKAIEDYMKALEYDETDMFAYNNSGYSYKALDEMDKAVEMLKKSIELMKEQGKRSLLPYNNLGSCYEVMGQYEKAIECYRENLKLYPNNSNLYERIAKAYIKLGMGKKAMETYIESKNETDLGNLEYTISIGEVHASMGEMLKAKLKFLKAENMAGVDAYDLCHLGNMWLFYFRNYNNAMRCFNKAFERAEKYTQLHWDILESMARCKAFTGNKKEAKELSNNALEVIAHIYGSLDNFMNFGQERPLNLGRIAKLYLYSERYDEAEALLEQMNGCRRCAFCKHGTCYDIFLYYGMYHELKKDYVKALEYYDKVYKINPYDNEIVCNIKEVKKHIKG